MAISRGAVQRWKFAEWERKEVQREAREKRRGARRGVREAVRAERAASKEEKERVRAVGTEGGEKGLKERLARWKVIFLSMDAHWTSTSVAPDDAGSLAGYHAPALQEKEQATGGPDRKTQATGNVKGL